MKSPARHFLTTVAIAVITTVVVLGPLAVLLWLSWRNVLAAALMFCAVLLVMFLILVAVQSSRREPRWVFAFIFILGAGLAYGAWTLAHGTLAVRIATVALSLAACAWAVAFWDLVAREWRSVRRDARALQ